MFACLKITTRIHLLLVLAAFGFLASSGIGLWTLRSQMLEDRQMQLRNLLDLTLSIARGDMMAAGGPTSEAGRKAFLSVLQSTRLGDEKEANSIFAFDNNGVTLSSVDRDKIGRNQLELTDANGVKLVQNLIQIAKSPSGTGFTTYVFPKGAGGTIAPKLTLVQNVPELHGLAGIGIYMDDLDVDFYKKAFIDGGMLAVLLLTIAVVGYLIGRSISKPLSDLATNIARLAKGDVNILLADANEKTELGDIARAVDVFRTAQNHRKCTAVFLQDAQSFSSKVHTHFHESAHSGSGSADAREG